MAEYYKGNRYLSTIEMKTNALYIYNYLKPRGWSNSAICGMLGNMERESTINPAIWEGLDSSDPSRGYGLVQWTPSTKYTDWCAENNFDHTSMPTALKRIIYEVENGLQWISTSDYPMTFKEFSTSNETPEKLAMAFMHNYERPADSSQDVERGQLARAWFDYLRQAVAEDSSTGSTFWEDLFDWIGDIFNPDPKPKEQKGLPLWLLISASRRF